MRMKLIVAACAAITSAPLMAEQGDEPDRTWKGDAELAYLLKRGNSETDTFQAKLNAEKDGIQWRHTVKAETANERAKSAATGETERTAERYFSSYKLDRKLGDDSPNYFFNIVTYDKDRFSGFHYQASYALGLGRRWLDSDRHTLDTEAGPGYRVVCLNDQDASYSDCGNTDEDAILRLAVKYVWTINEAAEFRETVSTEISDDITTTRAETSLTSRINGAWSMRVSHLLKHTSSVAAPAKKTDNEMSVSLVYRF